MVWEMGKEMFNYIIYFGFICFLDFEGYFDSVVRGGAAFS